MMVDSEGESHDGYGLGAVKDERWFLTEGLKLTSRGSWYLGTLIGTRRWWSGSCRRHGRELVAPVSRTWGAYGICYPRGFGGSALKPFSAIVRMFRRVWALKPDDMVLEGIKDGTWCHHERCFMAKLLREDYVVVKLKFQELVHFALAEWIGSIYLRVV